MISAEQAESPRRVSDDPWVSGTVKRCEAHGDLGAILQPGESWPTKVYMLWVQERKDTLTRNVGELLIRPKCIKWEPSACLVDLY